MNYTVDGPDGGPVVVLTGSLGSDLRMWDPQVRPLTGAGLRVVRHDLRGHGGSPVPNGPYELGELGTDVLKLLDELGIARAHFTGLSIGGMVGMWIAQHAPERLDRLVLCCTSAALGTPDDWEARAATVRAEGAGAVADSVVQRWFTDRYRAAAPERVAGFREMIAATPAEGYASCCTAIGTMELVPGLPSITAPTLVIAGAEDPATPPEHGRRIAESVADGRLEVLSPGAHLINEEQPDRVNELIVEHLTASGREQS